MHITWPPTKQAKQEMKASKVHQIDTTIQQTKLIMAKKKPLLTFCKCQSKGHNFLYSWHKWSVHSISIETLFYKEQAEFKKKKRVIQTKHAPMWQPLCLRFLQVARLQPSLSVVVNGGSKEPQRILVLTRAYTNTSTKDTLLKWGKENQCYATSQVKLTNFLNLSKKRKLWKEDFK